MNKNIRKVLLSLLGLIILIYGIGAVYFSMMTYPKTRVNNVDKGNISRQNLFQVEREDRRLLVIGRDGVEVSIESDDIDYKSSIAGKPVDKQKPLLWPIQFFQDHHYQVELNSDLNKSKLSSLVQASRLFGSQIEPRDAYLAYDDQEEKYVIIPEVLGTSLDYQDIEQAIIDAFNNQEEKISLEKYYKRPQVTKDDSRLLAEYEKLSKISNKRFVFDFEDREYVLTGKELFETYVETDGIYQVDRTKLKDYVAYIARETDTFNTERKFEATGIGEITVPGGIYGWQIDLNKTTDALLDQIESGKDGKVEIIYRNDGSMSYVGLERGMDDIGDTYLEADLSRQTLWYYEDGKLVLTGPFVSGQASSRFAATPVGVNKVRVKESPKILRGVNEIRGGEYEVPVTYWINIGWTGSGFHDVDYRKEFGGNIYKKNGSSSCLNTPLEVMEELYEKIDYNTPVIIYESSTNYSPTEFEKIAMNVKREEENKRKKKDKKSKKTIVHTTDGEDKKKIKQVEDRP